MQASNGSACRSGQNGDVEANVDIRDASKFDAKVEVRGVKRDVDLNRLGFLLGQGHRWALKPRSFAIMCEAVVRKRHRKQYRTLEYGKRIDGDFLIRFERHQVKPTGARFASHIFYFYDADVNITNVKLRIDVSCCSLCNINGANYYFHTFLSAVTDSYSFLR